MKRLFAAVLLALTSLAFGATTSPVSLINPAGSTAGQAIVSTGSSSAPAWGSVTAGNISGTFPSIAVAPTASTLNKAIATTQSVSGTTSANCTTDTLIMYPCVNRFYIASDNADASSAPGPVLDGWQFAHNFGGSTMKGGRQVLDVIGHFTAPSNAANTLPGYVGIVSELITNSGDNGTAPTIANGRGSFFATNPVVVANSGAQNLFGIAGEEVNVQCNGCSTAIRYGVSVVNNGANQGSILANDAAFHLGSFNSGGTWHQALNLSSVHGGPPLDTTGCVICTDSTAITIGTGIDLSAYTISGNFLKGPNGFAVDGSSNLTARGGSFGIGGVGTSGGLTVSAGGASITGGLGVTGAVSGTGFSNYLAAPPAIGGTTPAAGTFTTLKTTAQSKVIANNQNAQSIPNNTSTVVTTWTSVLNQGSNFNASTGVYTAPAAGTYRVHAALQFASAAWAAGNVVAIQVRQNNTVIYQSTHIIEAAVTQPLYTYPISVVLNCAASDTISVSVLQNQGGAVALSTTATNGFLMIDQMP